MLPSVPSSAELRQYCTKYVRAENERLRAELKAKSRPETVDLSAESAESDIIGRGVKRNAATAALHERVVTIKKEKLEAQEDAELQQETTEQMALTLDRWQSYADALKEQLRAAGKTPLSWECFQRSKS